MLEPTQNQLILCFRRHPKVNYEVSSHGVQFCEYGSNVEHSITGKHNSNNAKTKKMNFSNTYVVPEGMKLNKYFIEYNTNEYT